MYANGIYIQELSEEAIDFLPNGRFALVDKEYRGVARYISFPLSGTQDLTNFSLNRRMEQGVYKDTARDNDVDPLWVISDENLYREYLARCEELDIKTRVLFIESTRREPCWAGEKPEMRTLGYEVVNPNLGEVGICWYLNQEQFKSFAEKLNEHGLFDDYETAEAFYNALTEDPFVTEEEDPLIARISIVSI
ncbi:MAG: hypothetical protein II987_06495 [Clostridia bacterium]|nr:hypothetical protein [Clostridia bacterium]